MTSYRVYKNFQIRIPDELIDDPDLNDWTSLGKIKLGQMGKKPKYIEIQNLSSNIFTVAGYLMGLNIKDLFDNTITWVDSLQGTVYYEEFNLEENSLGAEYEIEIKRFSGPEDLVDDPNLAGIQAWSDNGYLAFSLVFHY